VGDFGNALIADHTDLPPFAMYTEVSQDSCVDAMRAGRLPGASASGLSTGRD
jgi:acyl-CoA hydrolase